VGLFGYIKKTRPAPWVALQSSKIVYKRPQRAKRVWTRKSNKSASQTILRTKATSLRRLRIRQYREDARAFVHELQDSGAKCPVWLAIPEVRNARRYGWAVSGKITECHHKFGRLGPLLNWKPGWLGVSKLGHRWIHQNIARARLHGWIAERGDWNNLNVILR
jgi:hypothetical protein